MVARIKKSGINTINKMPTKTIMPAVVRNRARTSSQIPKPVPLTQKMTSNTYHAQYQNGDGLRRNVGTRKRASKIDKINFPIWLSIQRASLDVRQMRTPSMLKFLIRLFGITLGRPNMTQLADVSTVFDDSTHD